MKDAGIDWRIILKGMLNRNAPNDFVNCIYSRWSQVTSCCEYGNELSGSKIYVAFVDKAFGCRLLNEILLCGGSKPGARTLQAEGFQVSSN